VRYFAWMYFRALTWIVICALALRQGTGNWKIVRAFFTAHLVALAFAVVTDVLLFKFAPPQMLRIEVLQWIFTIPIVIFTIISLWICNWEKDVKIPDVLITMVPIVMWGLLVIFGWQWGMAECHILGAWFSSAAAGAVDLYARYGPPWAARRPYLVRLAGYAVVVMTVYVLLPLTQ
jgi:hypothetical protein